MDAVRTPEERFEGLPDFPFESSYREIDGLRLAYLDEGEGKPVVFFHGEPTWSFLWRKVIPPVRDAGYRCIAPDYAGFGRSDKPTDLELVHVRPPRRVDGEAARGTRRSRRDRGRPRLGRADRAAAGGRAPGPLLAHRDHGDRPLHRPTADERGLAQVPRVRPRQRRHAGRDAGPRRLQEGSRRRGDRRLRRALPGARVEGGRAGIPADPADRARRARGGRGHGGSPTRCARTSGRRLVLWADSDPILPFSVGERVSEQLNSRRRARSRTPRTSCRRTPGRRSAGSSPSGSSLRAVRAAAQLLARAVDQEAHAARRAVVLDPGDGAGPVGRWAGRRGGGRRRRRPSCRCCGGAAAGQRATRPRPLPGRARWVWPVITWAASIRRRRTSSVAAGDAAAGDRAGREVGIELGAQEAVEHPDAGRDAGADARL